MSILDTFYILFDSDASKLDKGLEETKGKAEKLIDQLKGVDKEGAKAGASLYDLVGKAAGLLGVGLSIGALVAGVKSTAAAYDALGKLAARFGDTADAIDDFLDAGELLGISAETSTDALTALDRAVQDTFLGLGRAKKVFEEIGLSVTDAAGKTKPVTQVMGELAEKLHGMERGTQIRIMERLGLDPALLKVFNADMVGLQKRMGEIDRASRFDLDAAVKRATEYTKATKGLSLEVNTLKMYLEKMGEGLKLAAMPYFTEAINLAAKYTKVFVDFLLRHDNFLRGIFVAIGAAISYFLIPAAIKGAISVWAMVAPFLAVGLLVAAVGTAFALLYDDIVTFMEGGDSMIGQVLNRWPIIGQVVKGLVETLKTLWNMGVQVYDFFVDMWNDPQAAFQAFLDFVLDGIKAIIDSIPGLRKSMDAFGFGDNNAALEAGKMAISQASGSAFNSQTSNSVRNSIMGNRSTQVSVGKVEVKTSATDAEGISKAIGGSLRAQLQQATANYDDGVLG